ncbi:MAG TPA: DUF3617 family protein [Caulobacteraceae bacterium]|jgi:hypothetical protein|nr:DUF3617 family protein [Caulobacteraceae bacterium]
MAMTRVGLALTGAALLLAACSGKGGGGGAGGGGGPDTNISIADLPHVKPGYWQRVDTSNGGAPVTSHFCATGEAVDLGAVAKNCSTFTLKRSLSGELTTDATCASGQVTSTAHMTISGDFNSSYTSDAQVTVTIAGKPPQSFTSHAVTTYVGACPAGNAADNGT